MEISVGINLEFCSTAERRGIKLIKKWPYKAQEQGEFGLSFASQLVCSPGEPGPGSFCAGAGLERAGMGEIGRAHV